MRENEQLNQFPREPNKNLESNPFTPIFIVKIHIHKGEVQ